MSELVSLVNVGEQLQQLRPGQLAVLNRYAGYELAYAEVSGYWILRLSKGGETAEVTIGPTLLWTSEVGGQLSELARREVEKLKYTVDEMLKRRAAGPANQEGE